MVVRRQKNKKLRFVKAVILLVLVICFCIWGMRKTPWTQVLQSYSDLSTISETDSVDGVEFTLEKNKDYRIEGYGTVSNGPITVSCYLNGSLLDEQTIESGTYACRPVEVSGEGTLKICSSVAAGTEGSGNSVLYMRCRNWYRLYERIYDDFFAEIEE